MQNRPTTGAPLADGSPDPLSTPPYSAVDFRLSLPAYQTAWLKGASTNGGADSATDPDYIFCAPTDQPSGALWDENGLHLNLPAPAATNVVKVCSHDYGGVAIVRATVSIAGTPLEAQIVAATALSPPPPASAGTGQIARLPLAQGCNGIADSWEDKYKNAPGYSAIPQGETTNAKGDNDLGAKQPGDRLTNFEEYRGFHYVTDDWNENNADVSKIRWTSTDPVNSLDILFWDSTPDGWVTKAIRNGPGDSPPGILALQTPAIRYWRVNAFQAHAVDPNDAEKGVTPINGKTSSDPGLQPYAIAYADHADPLSKDDPPCGGENTVLGNSNIPRMGWAPLDLYSGNIRQCAVDRFKNAIPEDVLRAWVVAHETAHRFGLGHYSRQATYVISIPPLLKTQYAIGSDPRDLYTRFQVYQASEVTPPATEPQSTWELSDYLIYGYEANSTFPACALGDNKEAGTDPLPTEASYYFYPAGTTPIPGAADYPVLFHMLYPVPADVKVCSSEARDEIMDWFPRFVPANGAASQWKFSTSNPADLKNVCLTCGAL